MSTFEDLRNFALQHDRRSFADVVTAAINGEPWAVTRVNFALGCIATSVASDGEYDWVKLVILDDIRTDRPDGTIARA